MKKFLMAALAVFMMSGAAVAAEKAVVVENNVATTVSEENVADKLITLVKNYTKKINACKTVDELMVVAEKCYEEVTAFTEKYEEAFEALEEVLTEEQQAAYEKQLEKVMAEFEAAAEKKVEQLMGDLNF